jgi:ethanolamine utilization protein EutA (predicted chaperonin)
VIDISVLESGNYTLTISSSRNVYTGVFDLWFPSYFMPIIRFKKFQTQFHFPGKLRIVSLPGNKNQLIPKQNELKPKPESKLNFSWQTFCL